ncbi:hypothetical protein [Longimicrobium sp.]|uniref:hypothetical protein n=1 Tax=Longimicrobium sp. TaxID=2029185 RepID=UPI003B3A0BEF
MPYATLRRAAVSATLLTSFLLGACKGGGDDPEAPVADDSSNQNPAGRATTPEQTSTISIGLTGLILMLPVSNPAGTGLFMPKDAKDHVAYVGFKSDNKNCDGYNPYLGICFVSLENSTLLPIGVQSNTPHGATPHVVSVTRNSGGKKGEAGKVEAKSRARATLLSGSATEPCALARWTIDPHPPGEPVDVIEPANTLTWVIPNFPGTQLVLERRGGSPVRRDTLRAQQGRIELLIVHVPTKEFAALLEAKAPAGGLPVDVGSTQVDTAEINRHLDKLYGLIEVPDSQRPRPSKVEPKGNAICPINVLGLQNAVYPMLDPKSERLEPQARTGIRTYSCIIGGADPQAR